MLLVQGLCIRLSVPDTWSSFQDGARYVSQGPHDEELIVSGQLVTGAGGSASQAQAVLEGLLANGRRAMLEAASHPDLQVAAPLQRIVLATGLSAWLLHARTTDDSVLFSQAVIAHAHGTALLTFEAPNTSASREHFWAILNTISPTTPDDSGA